MQVLFLLIANWAIVLPLWLWNQYESRADRTNILNLINLMKDQMTDLQIKMTKLESKKETVSDKKKSK